MGAYCIKALKWIYCWNLCVKVGRLQRISKLTKIQKGCFKKPLKLLNNEYFSSSRAICKIKWFSKSLIIWKKKKFTFQNKAKIIQL